MIASIGFSPGGPYDSAKFEGQRDLFLIGPSESIRSRNHFPPRFQLQLFFPKLHYLGVVCGHNTKECVGTLWLRI